MSRALSLAVLSLGLLSATGIAQAELYGVTNTDFYRFDVGSLTTPTLIGSLGLTGSRLTVAMAYHETQGTLYLLTYRLISGNNYDQDLYAVNPATGATTLAANVGLSDSFGFIEGLEYDRVRGSLVVSIGPPADSFNTIVRKFNVNGTLGDVIASTGRDNDILAYDPTRNVLYGSDTNGGDSRLFRVDSGVPLSSFSHLGDPAYDAGTDAFYAVDYVDGSNPTGNRIFRVRTDGASAGEYTNLGAVIGTSGMVNSLVTVVPEPGIAAAAVPAAIVALRRRR